MKTFELLGGTTKKSLELADRFELPIAPSNEGDETHALSSRGNYVIGIQKKDVFNFQTAAANLSIKVRETQ